MWGWANASFHLFVFEILLLFFSISVFAFSSTLPNHFYSPYNTLWPLSSTEYLPPIISENIFIFFFFLAKTLAVFDVSTTQPLKWFTFKLCRELAGPLNWSQVENRHPNGKYQRTSKLVSERWLINFSSFTFSFISFVSIISFLTSFAAVSFLCFKFFSDSMSKHARTHFLV